MTDGTKWLMICEDRQHRAWHIMERTDGSVCVYYVQPQSAAQYVVFDTLDDERTAEARARVSSIDVHRGAPIP